MEYSDDELEALLDPIDYSRRFQPDFPAIELERGKRLSMRDSGFAYRIYLEQAEGSTRHPYTESSFQSRMREWLLERNPEVSMTVNWQKGEEIQVDWAGKKLFIEHEDGQATPAFLFVATSPYSDFTFVRASLDISMQSWLEHHIEMFEYFGGVPLFLAIDNLSTGVSFKNGKRKINDQYQALADHYDCMVVPARFFTPTDKAAVEGHVRIMANRIIGTLSKRKFSSIEQLNQEIAVLCHSYNDCLMHRSGRTRREIFEEERTLMQPLPGKPFEPVTWKKHAVSFDGVVRVRGNYYGVPVEYANQKVFVRLSDSKLSIFTADKKQCIAIHSRREDGLETFDGFAGANPDRFRKLDDWAEYHDRPLILKQWDYSKNEKSPNELVCRSLKEAAWKCSDCGYEWVEQIARRTSRSFDDCPRCAHIALIPGETDLAALYPDVASLWHPSKNPFRANQVFPDSRQTYWWQGACGHEWRKPVSDMVRSAEGRLCPVCQNTQLDCDGTNSVATMCPELIEHWHPSKNRNVKAENTPIGHPFAVYLWDGIFSHIFRSTPRAWMINHGYSDAFKTADQLMQEAKAYDAANPWVPTPTESLPIEMATVKWSHYSKQFGVRMSLEEWCKLLNRQDLLDEWDYDRNELKPEDYSRSSSAKVWWHGSCGHSWLEQIRSRTYSDSGCLYCGKRRALDGFNSVIAYDARLLQQWHPTKNADITPESITDRAHGPIWWQCPKCGFEWQESLRRTKELSQRCPSCYKREQYLVPGKNDLKSKFPKVAAEIDPELNGDVNSQKLFTHTKKMLWWRGTCGHVWRQRIDQRTSIKTTACPYCSNRKLLKGFNDLESVNPEAAKLWHQAKNGDTTPSTIRFNTRKAYWWQGPCGHEWQARVFQMNVNPICPICNNRQAAKGENDLKTTHPELAAQWAHELNGSLAPDCVTSHSSKRVWWKCELGHTWESEINYRASHNSGCPVCASRILLVGFNDLKTVAPKIAKEWDKRLNGDLKPQNVKANSSKKVWWRCANGHAWEASVANRVNHHTGCPYCKNRAVWKGYNDLESQHPNVAKQLHPRLNNKLKANGLLATSRKAVWWHADCGHTWKQKVCDRVKSKSQSCPVCTGRIKPERPIKLG